MIGSHNTFTYLTPSCKIHNLTKRWWKTQCKTIKEQYDFGIRMFDIRVCLKGNKWTYCHGLINFKEDKRDLMEICSYMKTYFPEAIYRIVLEKGNKLTQRIFINEARHLCELYPNLWRVDIKSYKKWYGFIANNNKNLYNRGYLFAYNEVWDTPCHEIHGFVTKKNFLKINLAKEAKKLNKDTFSKEDLLSKDTLYFIDYCTNEYK